MEQKRCYGQEDRLLPLSEVNQLIEYSLAYCAKKYSIDLHEFLYMPNHEHVDLTDPQAKRPRFFQLLHSLIARSVNSIFGDTDALWSTQKYSAPVVLDAKTHLEKLLYVLLNPVTAGYVRYVWDWAGVSSLDLEYDKPKPIKRPSRFFSDNMPAEVELVIRRPPGVRPDLDDAALRKWIREQAVERQRQIFGEFKKAGRTFLGMDRLLRRSRHARPRARKIRDGIRPNVAGPTELRVPYLQRLTEFRRQHRVARLRRKDGDYSAVFPFGTYLARVQDGAPCHPRDGGPAP